MPYIAQTRDLTNQYLSYGRNLSDYRPVAGTTYALGMNVNLVPQDQMTYPDAATVQPTPTAAAQQSLVVGVVCENWAGFNLTGIPPAPPTPQQPPSFTSPSSIRTVRGSQGVLLVVRGYCPAVLVDATTGSAIGNGTLLVPSATTAGYAQGATTAPIISMGLVGGAMLPSSGMGSAIAGGALVQASQTATIATPQAGDVISVTLQMPYSSANPGVPQTQTFSYTVKTTDTTATITGNSFVTFLNGTGAFAQYYIATNAAGVVTIAVNALATPFPIYVGFGNIVTGQWNISLSGMIGNSITFAATKTGLGTTTIAAGGATLAGGAGFKGYIPAFITGADV